MQIVVVQNSDFVTHESKVLQKRRFESPNMARRTAKMALQKVAVMGRRAALLLPVPLASPFCAEEDTHIAHASTQGELLLLCSGVSILPMRYSFGALR